MSAASVKHLVAVPFPGRGHVNTLLSFCNLLLDSTPAESTTIVTFVVTEEWLDLITASTSPPLHHHPQRLCFATMPNVVPSERNRGSDHAGFIQAVFTKMEPHFDHLLTTLDPPPSAIISDTYVLWAVEVGNRRHVPVFSFFPMPPAIFSFLFRYDWLVERGIVPPPIALDGEGRPLSSTTAPLVELPIDEGGEIVAECFPGVCCGIRLTDFTSVVNYAIGLALSRLTFTCLVGRVQGIILNAVYELDPEVIDALRADPDLPFPIYTIGPCIPFDRSLLQDIPGAAGNPAVHNNGTSIGNNDSSASTSDYLSWLDLQPAGSVLYVSLGSFLSTSGDQMEELAMGLVDAGIPFVWVLRDESRSPRLEAILETATGRTMGMTVPWCDQLRVLCHPSVGAFLTHCGWNSTLEGLFAGKPMLAMPIAWDQPIDGAMIARGWGVGVRLKDSGKEPEVVKRDKIAEAVGKIIGPSTVADEFRKNAADIMEKCRRAVRDRCGSSIENLEAFVNKIEQVNILC